MLDLGCSIYRPTRKTFIRANENFWANVYHCAFLNGWVEA